MSLPSPTCEKKKNLGLEVKRTMPQSTVLFSEVCMCRYVRENERGGEWDRGRERGSSCLPGWPQQQLLHPSPDTHHHPAVLCMPAHLWSSARDPYSFDHTDNDYWGIKNTIYYYYNTKLDKQGQTTRKGTFFDWSVKLVATEKGLFMCWILHR